MNLSPLAEILHQLDSQEALLVLTNYVEWRDGFLSESEMLNRLAYAAPSEPTVTEA